jgi:hypothetical protein
MLDHLSSGDEIAQITHRLLDQADAYGRLPTPVDDLIAAADLFEPGESLLSDAAIADAPRHLRKAMRRLRAKAQALLDRKAREIHIHPDVQNDGQRRFKQLHEVAHGAFPWQDALAYADDHLTLSWTTKQMFEREANQGGAELLFQRERFAEMAQDYETAMASVVELSTRFGASIHASFRRYVETHQKPLAGLVLQTTPCQEDPVGYRRQEALNSEPWKELYGSVSGWPDVLSPPFTFVNLIEGLTTAGTRKCSLTYPDLNNEMTQLQIELLNTTYRVLVLIWPPRRERFKRRRVLVPSREWSD